MDPVRVFGIVAAVFALLIVAGLVWYWVTATVASGWKMAKVRFLFQLGPEPHKPFYVRMTPNFGFGIPLRATKGGNPRRLRFGPHHGLQKIRWIESRWVVEKQVMGRSRVVREMKL